MRKVSLKQQAINRRLTIVYREIDSEREPICEGCHAWERPLSHAHIISQARCKELGKPELITDKKNLALLCCCDSDSCHYIFDNGSYESRSKLLNFSSMLEFIKQHDPERFKILELCGK